MFQLYSSALSVIAFVLDPRNRFQELEFGLTAYYDAMFSEPFLQNVSSCSYPDEVIYARPSVVDICNDVRKSMDDLYDE